MSDTGWKYGTTSSVITTGSYDWANPDLAKLSDNQFSVSTITGANNTHILKIHGFGLSIPLNSTIDGMEVGIAMKSNGSDVKEKIVQIHTTSLIGSNLATNQAIPTSSTPFSYGSSTNGWGASLTTGIVNDDNFGIAFVAGSATEGTTVSVDVITIKVYYTEVLTPVVGQKYALPPFRRS